MSSRSSTAQQEVQRVLKEVHNDYYANRPDPTIALRGYLDESLSLNRAESEELDPSFEAYCTAYVPSTPSIPSLSLGNGVHHPAGEATGRSHQHGPTEEIDTSAYTTIPTYRFCRPVERTVYRKLERFTTFTPAVMLDDGQYVEYREKLVHTEWLSEQPGRSPAGEWSAYAPSRTMANWSQTILSLSKHTGVSLPHQILLASLVERLTIPDNSLFTATPL